MKRILIVVLTVALLLPAVLALTVPSAAAAAGVPHWFVRQGEFTPDGVYDEASESALLTQPLNAERTVMAGGVWDLTAGKLYLLVRAASGASRLTVAMKRLEITVDVAAGTVSGCDGAAVSVSTDKTYLELTVPIARIFMEPANDARSYVTSEASLSVYNGASVTGSFEGRLAYVGATEAVLFQDGDAGAVVNGRQATMADTNPAVTDFTRIAVWRTSVRTPAALFDDAEKTAPILLSYDLLIESLPEVKFSELVAPDSMVGAKYALMGTALRPGDEAGKSEGILFYLYNLEGTGLVMVMCDRSKLMYTAELGKQVGERFRLELEWKADQTMNVYADGVAVFSFGMSVRARHQDFGNGTNVTFQTVRSVALPEGGSIRASIYDVTVANNKAVDGDKLIEASAYVAPVTADMPMQEVTVDGVREAETALDAGNGISYGFAWSNTKKEFYLTVAGEGITSVKVGIGSSEVKWSADGTTGKEGTAAAAGDGIVEISVPIRTTALYYDTALYTDFALSVAANGTENLREGFLNLTGEFDVREVAKLSIIKIPAFEDQEPPKTDEGTTEKPETPTVPGGDGTQTQGTPTGAETTGAGEKPAGGCSSGLGAAVVLLLTVSGLGMALAVSGRKH